MPGDADTFFRSVLSQNDRAPSYTITFRGLSPGVAGTEETLAIMAAAVRGELEPDHSGFRDEYIRSCAASITSATTGHDVLGDLHALFNFVRDKIKYLRDPVDLERVQDAKRTLQLGTGDCDDKCVLLATLLASIGYLPRFTVQSQNSIDFDHVYVEVLDDQDQAGAWIPLDPTADGLNGTPRGFPGWRHPAPIEWTYEIFPTGETTMMSMAVRAALGQISPYDDAWYERYIYDISSKIVDVIGTDRTNTPYIPPGDPRYRNPQQIYVPVPGGGMAPAPATRDKQSSGFQLGQSGVSINYLTAAAILAGVVIFMTGRKGR